MIQRTPNGTIPLFMTVDEVKDFLGVSQRTVHRLASSGKIPGCFKVGNLWRIPTDSLPGIEVWRARIASEKAPHAQA